MLDLIRPTSGTIRIFGRDARCDALAIHQRIGYLPGDVRLPGDLTAKQFLARYWHMAGLAPVLLPKLREHFDIPLNRKLKGFSKGMRQMLAIIQAFMCDPELVILDEPTSGLDPLGQRAFNEFLLDEAGRGRTVFMSSHILSDVEKTCQRVAVIRNGELVTIETIERLRERAGQTVTIEFADGSRPEADLQTIASVRTLERRQDGTCILKIVGDIDPLIKALARYQVRRLAIEEAPLEEVLMQFYTGDNAGSPMTVPSTAKESWL
jgi:ABC-2 type transport system ATP-binding protein